MPWLNNPIFTIDEAVQRGVDVYEVLVSNWGDEVGGDIQWPPAGSPPMPVSVAGIAIGPRSTVDRCYVSYDLQKRDVNATTHATDRIRRLSVDAPLIYTQSANIQKPVPNPVIPYVQQPTSGPLQIFAFSNDSNPTIPTTTYGSDLSNSTILPQNYRDVNGVLRTFGQTQSPPDNSAMFPFLHLLLFLKGPPAFVPQKRSPLIVTGSSVPSGLVLNQEVIVAQVPVFGRRHIKLMLRAAESGGTATIDWRVGAIRGISQNPTGLGCYEEPVDSATGVAFQTPVIMEPCIGQGLFADYLNIYATLRTNTGAGTVTAVFQMTAYD